MEKERLVCIQSRILKVKNLFDIYITSDLFNVTILPKNITNTVVDELSLLSTKVKNLQLKNENY